MAGERIPVRILTGFLGSGKSTLLSAALREPTMADAAVIVNEFGEVGLDHLLIARGGEDTILLDSGCLCCLGGDALQDTLMMMLSRREREEIISFSRVLIETSGLADPAPLLQPLLADPFVSRHFALHGITVVVDAVLGAEQIEHHDEARRQIAVADRIILAKCDVADSAEQAATRAAIRSVNTRCGIEESWLGIANPADLLGLNSQGLPASESATADLESHPADHMHSCGVVSHVFRPTGHISWSQYARWVTALRAVESRRLLRTKGILRFDDGINRIIQGVQHVFAPPREYDGSDVDPFVVVIVDGVEKADLEAASAAILT